MRAFALTATALTCFASTSLLCRAALATGHIEAKRCSWIGEFISQPNVREKHAIRATG